MTVGVLVIVTVLLGVFALGMSLWLWTEQVSHHHGIRQVHCMTRHGTHALIIAGSSFNGRVMRKGDTVLTYGPDHTVELHHVHPTLTPQPSKEDVHRYEALMIHGRPIVCTHHNSTATQDLGLMEDLRIYDVHGAGILVRESGIINGQQGHLKLHQRITDGRLVTSFSLYMRMSNMDMPLQYILNSPGIEAGMGVENKEVTMVLRQHVYPLGATFTVRMGTRYLGKIAWVDNMPFVVRVEQLKESQEIMLKVVHQDSEDTAATVQQVKTAMHTEANHLLLEISNNM